MQIVFMSYIFSLYYHITIRSGRPIIRLAFDLDFLSTTKDLLMFRNGIDADFKNKPYHL